jgi:class 3 adenylate cyclase
MKLPGDDEGGLTLARWLRTRESAPEVIILTAFPTFENASKCMQAGAFSYVEKGTPKSFDLLETACTEASEQWYRRQQRPSPPLIGSAVALLCGDVIPPSSALQFLRETEEREADRLLDEFPKVTSHTVKEHGGYITTWSAKSIVAVFSAVDQAMKTAFAIRRTLSASESPQASSPLQFRASVHWGVVDQRPVSGQVTLQDTVELLGVKALTRAHAGQVVLTQQAREQLGQAVDFQIDTLPPEAQRLPDEGRLTGLEGTLTLYTAQEPLPSWVRFALKTAQESADAGLDLPPDLAEHHDDYAQRKQVL